MDMRDNVYSDTTGKRVTLADYGKTWASDEWLASMGWTLQDKDYQPIVPASTLLTNAKTEKENQIKRLLAKTDYKAIKWSEGCLTDEQYAETKAYREALRTAYNEIELASTLTAVNSIIIPVE